MQNMFHELNQELEKEQNPKHAEVSQRFFKTGKGQYGEGDVFLGIKVPVLRKISKKYKELSLENIESLLESNIHENRLVALFILIQKYKEDNKEIFDFYLSNIKNINNWDLVDLSAPNIVGEFLLKNKNMKNILYDFSKSDNLWKKRIAIVSTFAFIKNNDFEDALKISKLLLNDKHDLIHKAVGWMLREIGKRDLPVLEDFLKKHCKTMPRTMLRYSIEKFPEAERKVWLKIERT